MVGKFLQVFGEMLYADGPHGERNAYARDLWAQFHELAHDLEIQPIAGVWLSEEVVERVGVSEVGSGKRIDMKVPDRLNLVLPPFRHYGRLILPEVVSKRNFEGSVRLSIPVTNSSGIVSSYQPKPIFVHNHVSSRAESDA